MRIPTKFLLSRKSFYLASEIQSFLLQRGKNVVNNK